MSQMIYGVHPVSEALHLSHHQIEKIVIGSQKPSPALQGILDLAARNRVTVTFASKESLDQMTGGALHQNVVMFLREASSYCSLEELLSHWKKEGNRGLFLILDEIQDPQNFGALVRTALGCGAHGVIIPKDRAVGVTPAAVKASAGATAHMKIARVVNIANTIEFLKKEGFWVYGAALEGEDLLYDLDFNIDLAIVIGGEGKGIRPLVRKKCDRLFSIPMKGPLLSFNASVSGGMILYEVMRQRNSITKGS